MPRLADVKTWRHFREPEMKAGKRTLSRRCKYCNHAVSSTSVARAIIHLKACVAFNALAEPSDTASGNATTSPPSDHQVQSPVQTLSAGLTSTAAPQSNSRTASRPTYTISEAERQNLHRLAAKWIYEAGLPLSLLEHPAAREFLANLNAAYTPPDRRDIVLKLVTEVPTSERAQANTPAWLQLWMDRQVPPVRP